MGCGTDHAEELEEIKNAYELMEFYTHKKEYEKTSEQNTHFHELIYKASHNRLLTQILTSYQYYTKQFKVGSEANYDHMDDLLEELTKFCSLWRRKMRSAGWR